MSISAAKTSPDPIAALARQNAEGRIAESLLGANPVVGLTRAELLGSVRSLLQLLTANPRVVITQEREFMAELGRILLGRSALRPDPRDPRFAQPVWHKSPYYRRVLQAYLAWARSLQAILDGVEASPHRREQARFVLMQLVDAAAPTNYPLGNPAFLTRVLETGGGSVLKGLRNFIDDLRSNRGMPRQVDERPFRVGRNLACSEGAVVFRNPVCEVIQYRPRTSLVQSVPLLILPPQINKYYILDLAPENSFVRYAADNGLQVFCISWRNPTAAQRDWGLETYITAAREAIDAVREITGSPSVNLAAACVGGFTAALLLGHLRAMGDGGKVNSLTLLVSALDTHANGLPGLFDGEAGLKAATARSRRQGVLDGREMARAFAWMRPGELVWPFVVNNYLLGRDPPALDILYWNQDTTRLPAQFHADLFSLFRSNALAQPGTLKVLGSEIDLKQVDCDVFVTAGISDHVAPWQSCYRGARLFGGAVKFVLANSGHLPTLVCPPDNPRAKFYVHDDYALAPEDWLEQATLKRGSWWAYWRSWIAPRSGTPQPAPAKLGSSKYPAGDAAPGRYVYQR
ncbi:MAG TPA: alpha/beta fold hydrolase [Nevskiales bacterium]|nr:alpha/beta fold hydrolase [Nevskiales bacterium]